ncbi:ATP-binding protein [Leptospira stimsonii]|uniref:ATP-binding protein n=1 Tax=Leptospira stimsonii TaxID=2202203 RepID=A0ABY2MZD5_9LEPT|nr:ATP-binding protein [Leptospira stimsonii]TGK15743.1 ATP-binding protein [Leptospira stimsonii]TGM12551.1 ATP-binding protein [Leptospira stimsonii]
MSKSELIIPITYEEMTQKLGNEAAKLAQIIQPVSDTENEINLLLNRIVDTGLVTFFLGRSGVGKSTFLTSLKWRSHIKKREIINIDSSEIVPELGLNGLYLKLADIGKAAKGQKDLGATIVIIDYLESIEDQIESEIKSFFRNINALLRKVPVFIIWPITLIEDARFMLEIANSIATTLFYPGKEIINFEGPNEGNFIDISKRTIQTINEGKEPAEFGITDSVLSEIYSGYLKISNSQRTIRLFLQMIKTKWEQRSGYLSRLKETIPKPIEVWFIFSYPRAESVTSQFSKKGQSVDEAWTPVHDKFFEYIPGSQRSSIWDANRLQLALYGYIKTRIMFLPTNTLIAIIAAYSENKNIKKLIDDGNAPKHWFRKSVAKTFFSSTTIAKQLLGEKYPAGLRKGGPVAQAMDAAAPIFSELNVWLTKSGGSDSHINKAISLCVNELVGDVSSTQKSHPWLKRIIPDVLIELPDKTISLEFHYTTDDAPSKIADYTLSKLNVYMNQIEEVLR